MGLNATLGSDGWTVTLDSDQTPIVVNTRDGLSRVTSYAQNGITYTVTYGDFGVSTISGGGVTRTVARDSSGLITGVTDA